MTEPEFIDLAQTTVDQVPTTDGGSTARRARILAYAQETLNTVFTLREWDFRWKEFTVTIASGATSGDLPSDFSDLPASGARCWNFSTGNRVEFVPPQAVMNYQSDPSDSVSEPDIYSIYGENESSDPFAPQFQVRKLTAAADLRLWAHRKPWTLSETTSDQQLPLFPSQWIYNVLLPGTRALMQQSKGDATNYWQQYDAGLRRMMAQHPQVKSAHTRPQNFFGRRFR